MLPIDATSALDGSEMDATNPLHFVQIDQLPAILFLILVAWLIARLGTRFLDALGERFTERRLLFKQTATMGRFIILVVTTFTVIGSLFDLSAELLAYGGTATVAVLGLAFKDLWASLLAGVILLFERPFSVGDRITFDGEYGEVVEMGLRTVRLVTLDDNLVSIPNNRFLTEVVASANAGALDQMCELHFFVGCNENFVDAKRIVWEAAASSRYVYLNKPIVVVMREGPVPDGAERFAIQLTVKAYVLDGRYETALGTDIHERVKVAFRRAGIRTAGEIEWGPANGNEI